MCQEFANQNQDTDIGQTKQQNSPLKLKVLFFKLNLCFSIVR